MRVLSVAEKPSVAKELARILSNVSSIQFHFVNFLFL